MKKYILLTMLSTLITALLFANTLGQTAIRDQILQEIKKNEELLITARKLVIETNSTKARALLSSSSTIHNEAKKLFQLAEENYLQGREILARQQLLKARDLTFTARETILRTIAIAKREAKTEENARKAMEHAWRLLERAQDLMGESEGPAIPSARKLIEESRLQLGRARANMREHMFEVALRLARFSESLSTKAIKILKRDIRGGDEVARELRKTDRVLERIEEKGGLAGHPQAQKTFAEALSLQTKAKHSLELKKHRAAMELTTKAKQLAFQTMKLLAAKTSRENVEQAILFTDRLLEKALDIAKRQHSNAMRKRLENAAKLQKRAKENFEKGKLDDALRLTRKARAIMKETLNALDLPLKVEEVKSTLQATDALLDRVRTAVGIGGEGLAKELLEKAEKHQKRAWEGFNQTRLRAALAQTKLARNLANKALEQASNEGI